MSKREGETETQCVIVNFEPEHWQCGPRCFPASTWLHTAGL